MKNRQAYKQAKKRLEERYGFYVHLIVFIAINLLLAIINLSTSSETLWFQYPLLGWGIGLVFHALSVFVFEGKTSMITEEMIENEMSKRSY